MRSVVDRNVVMRGVTVLQWLGCGVSGRGPVPGGKGDFSLLCHRIETGCGTQPQISLVQTKRKTATE